MWSSLIQAILVSIAVIWIVHYGLQYLKNNYTIKKTKDVLSIQSEKYEKMIKNN